MPYKNKEDAKANHAKWREKNRDKINLRAKDYLPKYYAERKKLGLCRKCNNELFSACLCKNHREEEIIIQKAEHIRLKTAAMQAYGGKCACPKCPETNAKFLTIDHINNDGSAHRREMKGKGCAIYRWLKHNNYPDGFQVLCWNCNSGRGANGGICPHLELN